VLSLLVGALVDSAAGLELGVDFAFPFPKKSLADEAWVFGSGLLVEEEDLGASWTSESFDLGGAALVLLERVTGAAAGGGGRRAVRRLAEGLFIIP